MMTYEQYWQIRQALHNMYVNRNEALYKELLQALEESIDCEERYHKIMDDREYN